MAVYQVYMTGQSGGMAVGLLIGQSTASVQTVLLEV